MNKPFVTRLFMASQPTPPRNKALIFGLLKGNQWVFISPDHEAGYFFCGDTLGVVFFSFSSSNFESIQGTILKDKTWGELL